MVSSDESGGGAQPGPDEAASGVQLWPLVPESELPVQAEWAEVLGELDLEALIDDIFDRCLRVSLAREFLDQAARTQLRVAIEQNVHNLHAILAGEMALSEIPLTELLNFARLQAGLGIPQANMQQSYRLSFFTQWRAWQHLLASRGAGAEAEAKVARAVFTYQDHVSTHVAQVHGAYYDALSRSREHARRLMLRELATGSIELTAADRVLLGYDIDRWHCAVVMPVADEAATERLARRLRERRPEVDVVWQPSSSQGTELWVGSPGAWDAEAEDDLLAALTDSGLVASVGQTGRGPVGFRRAHQTAQAVQRLREQYRGKGRQSVVLVHRDLQVELLVLQNDDDARDFVEQTLGPLAAETETSQRLRRTLQVWFRTGTFTETAAELRYHEHTVRNRVLKVEELLGHDLRDRSLELQLALRLVDYLIE